MHKIKNIIYLFIISITVFGCTLPAASGSGGSSTTTTTTTTVNTVAANPPTIASFSPTSGPATTSVIITGTNFDPTTSVLFNGIIASSVTINSGTQLTAIVPTGATSGNIRVANSKGYIDSTTTSLSPNTFSVTLAPGISSFTPTIGIVGTTVTINGVNYDSNTTVSFNGIAATTVNLVSSTQITAVVPSGATTGLIKLTNTAGNTSSSSNFTVEQTPTITGFTPSSGPVTTIVTINGTNFYNGMSVSFHGTAATTVTYVNATQITAVVPTGATTGAISVTNLAGSVNSSSNFTVTLAPIISNFSPTSGPVTTTTVTINGLNFDVGTTVSFNGTPSTTVTFVNSTQITAVVPSGATTGLITVTNSVTSANSATNFTVTASTPPSISSFSPTSGQAVLASPITVTINGSNFDAGTTVSFTGSSGQVSAPTTYVNSTQLTATLPYGAITGVITATNAAGSGPSSSNFTVIPKYFTYVPASTSSTVSTDFNNQGYSEVTSGDFSKFNLVSGDDSAYTGNTVVHIDTTGTATSGSTGIFFLARLDISSIRPGSNATIIFRAKGPDTSLTYYGLGVEYSYVGCLKDKLVSYFTTAGTAYAMKFNSNGNSTITTVNPNLWHTYRMTFSYSANPVAAGSTAPANSLSIQLFIDENPTPITFPNGGGTGVPTTTWNTPSSAANTGGTASSNPPLTYSYLDFGDNSSSKTVLCNYDYMILITDSVVYTPTTKPLSTIASETGLSWLTN